MSQHFALGGQSIGASASVLPVNIQGWFPLELTGLGSWKSKGLEVCYLSEYLLWGSDKKKDQERLLAAQQEGKLSEKAQKQADKKKSAVCLCFFKNCWFLVEIRNSHPREEVGFCCF